MAAELFLEDVAANEAPSARTALDKPSLAAGGIAPRMIDRQIANQSWREAGRLNAGQASDRELAELLAERKALLAKKLEQTLNREDSDRLEYVRWSLDRIEDARHGHALDQLEH